MIGMGRLTLQFTSLGSGSEQPVTDMIMDVQKSALNGAGLHLIMIAVLLFMQEFWMGIADFGSARRSNAYWEAPMYVPGRMHTSEADICRFDILDWSG